MIPIDFVHYGIFLLYVFTLRRICLPIDLKNHRCIYLQYYRWSCIFNIEYISKTKLL